MAAARILDIGIVTAPAAGLRTVALDDTARFAALDVKTTGLGTRDRVVEVAVAVVDRSGVPLTQRRWPINPRRGITGEHLHPDLIGELRDAPEFADIADELAALLDGNIVVAHSIQFENRFCTREFRRAGRPSGPHPALCTLALARTLELPTPDHQLGTRCAHLGISTGDLGTAAGDVAATAALCVALLDIAAEQLGCQPELTLGDVAPRPLTASTRRRTAAATRPSAPPAPDPSPSAPASVDADAAEHAVVEPGEAVDTPVSPDELRAPGALGTRRHRGWTCLHTPLGARHPDQVAPSHSDAAAAANTMLAIRGTPRPVDDATRWLCDAFDDLVQRGTLPVATRRVTEALAAEFGDAAPVGLTAALAATRAAGALDPAIELHPTWEQPFWELLCERLPRIAAWTFPQTSLDSLIRHPSGDRFVDFCIAAPWAAPHVVELDGTQHRRSRAADRERDRALRATGITVARHPGSAATDTSSELWAMLTELEAAAPDVQPSPAEIAASLGPTHVARFTAALTTAVRHGWLRRGAAWHIGVDDDLGLLRPAVLAAAVNHLVDIADVWGIDFGGPVISVGDTVLVRDGRRYRPDPDAVAPAATPDVHLEVSGQCHSSHALDGTPADLDASAVPRVAVRASLPIGRHPWPPRPRPRRPVNPDRRRLAEALISLTSDLFGHDQLREEQFRAVATLCDGDDLVAVLPTGYGKTLIYQLAGLLTGGATIVIDPINALIDDQQRRFDELGIDRCVAISSNVQRDPAARSAVLDAVADGSATFVLCSPERFGTQAFRDAVTAAAAHAGVGLCVIDEAHCVSEWGHDFRTSYLRLAGTLRSHTSRGGSAPPLLAATGTASPAVLRDVLRELGAGDDSAVLRPRHFERPNLSFAVDRRRLPRVDRLASALTSTIPDLLGRRPEQLFDRSGTSAGIVFVPHTNGIHGLADVAADVSAALARAGLSARIGVYSGGAPRGVPADRWNRSKVATAAAFAADELDILVATKAYGMGVDKRNIDWTLHTNLPASIEAFAQEAGRAGRDPRRRAACVLLADLPPQRSAAPIGTTRPSARHDVELQLHFHRNSFPGADIETTVALELYGDLVAAAGSALRIPRGDELRQRALHRLATLGLIGDYTVQYGSDTFEVELCHPDNATLDDAWTTWADRVEPGRPGAHRHPLDAAPTDPHARALHHLALVVACVYRVIEPARRHAILSMADLAAHAGDSADISARISAYLSDGPLAAALRRICDAPNLDVVDAVRQLNVVADAAAGEWVGASDRQLDDNATHPVAHAARALGEVLLVDGERARFAEHARRALVELGNYGADSDSARRLWVWLLDQVRRRGHGHRAGWAADLWHLWGETGWPQQATVTARRAVLDEGSTGALHPAELRAVLDITLCELADLVDTPAAGLHGAVHG